MALVQVLLLWACFSTHLSQVVLGDEELELVACENSEDGFSCDPDDEVLKIWSPVSLMQTNVMLKPNLAPAALELKAKQDIASQQRSAQMQAAPQPEPAQAERIALAEEKRTTPHRHRLTPLEAALLQVGPSEAAVFPHAPDAAAADVMAAAGNFTGALSSLGAGMLEAVSTFGAALMQLATEGVASAGPIAPGSAQNNPQLQRLRKMIEARDPFYKFPTVACILVIGLMLLAIVLHELPVHIRGKSPALAIPLPERSWWLRTVLLLACCQNFVEATTFIPLTYDLAQTLGAGSAGVSSGLLVGLCFFGFAPGGRMAIKTLPEDDWQQPRVRRRLLSAYALDILSHLVTMVLLTVPHLIASPKVLLWVLAGIRLFSGICIGYNMLGVMILSQRITPPCVRNDYSILVQVMRNAGFMLGPCLCSMVLFCFRHLGIEATVFEETAGCALALAVTTTVLMGMFALTIPLEAPLAESEDGKFAGEYRPGQVAIEEFPDSTRSQMVWLLTSYGAERAFTIAGVEVATLMILETVYGWDVETCGFVLTGVAGISTFGCLGLLLLLRNGMVTERGTFLSLAVASLVGALLLFQVSSYGPVSLLIADVLIYGSASVANGLAEGWAMRAVKPGTSFSNESRLKIMVMSVTFSRLISPPISRGLVELAGRNAYAGMQLLLILAGFMTVVKCCQLVKVLPPGTGKSGAADAMLKKGIGEGTLSDSKESDDGNPKKPIREV